MTTTDILRMIALPEYIQTALSAVSCPHPIPSYGDFQTDPAILSPYAEKENGLVILRLFLEWIPVLKAQYDNLGIPEAIFRENLKDISIWTKDYWSKHHSPGFSEWEWVWGFMSFRNNKKRLCQRKPCASAEPFDCLLSLDTGMGNSLNKLLLKNRKQDDNGDHRHQRTSHDTGRICNILSLQVRQGG